MKREFYLKYSPTDNMNISGTKSASITQD